ncbi:uncharacterized protein LOC108108830 [Drosophila eugracilis]|uniref:uncharacterized protein LOC108108830 n=1 Tax=Drosophila eugracilis TaxID=29029 RepID=UPI0007E6E89D|nr:uncharacterized protein LOC108108830 [Drosophila eugracilis]
MLSNISFSPAPELVDLYGLVLQFLVPAETTLFYFNPTKSNCSWEILQRTNLTQQPQIVWLREEMYPGLYNRHSSQIFAMVCLSERLYEWQIRLLAKSLTRFRFVRILIEIQDKESYFLASQVLSLCQHYSMLNVVMYFQRWTRHLNIYTYTAFPYFNLAKQRLSGASPPRVFTNQLADLRGYQLRVQPDLSPPNSFSYRDKHGETRIGGFMWKIIENFSETLGAGIQILYPTWRKAQVSSSEYMLEFTRNGSSDFGLTTNMIIFKPEERYQDYSYPMFYSSWCTMLPLEKPLSVHTLFGHVLTSGTVVLLHLIAILCFLVVPQLIKLLHIRFRGKLIRLALRIFSLVMLSASSAQLLSLLIFPPVHSRIKSFDDLLLSGLKIFGMRNEFYFLDGSFRAKYASAFYLTDNPNALYDNRNYFNTSWAYTITSVKWRVIEAQQRHFAHPVFRFSEDLCFNWSSPCALLIAPESIYRESLHHFTLRADEAGLINLWMTQSFYDMVRAGRMTIKDYSGTTVMRALRTKDLRICWTIFAAGLGTSSVVFTIELLLFYTNVFLNSL